MTRLLLPLLAALACLAALPAAASADLYVGIADQKPAMFSDPRFQELEIKRARYVVPWDVLSERWTREELDVWMAEARRAGVTPLLTFGHSRRPGLRRMLPTPRRLQREFRRLRERFPWAKEWATWNEPNHCGEPTCKRPDVVARMHDALRRSCSSCTILAAEVLDMPNMASWTRRMKAKTKVKPRWWGLHNYIDTNRFRTSGTRALLKATGTGQVWFTETGGVLRRQDARNRVTFPGGSAHAVKALRWLFDRLVPLDERRITRVYLYHWNASSPQDTWDSALINSEGLSRKALAVVEDVLGELKAARAAKARARRAR